MQPKIKCLIRLLFQGCGTCGSKDCARHDPGVPVEPWVGLQIHKQLDQAIEDVSFVLVIIIKLLAIWY
jgi:hypothetical protein